MDSPGTKGTAAQKEECTATIRRAHGEPFYNVSKSVDIWDGESRRSNDVIGPLPLKYLDQHSKGRFLVFCHFIDPDHEGHAHGENSRDYNDAIIACDAWLGKAVRGLKELGAYDRTMVMANSDHGLDEWQKGHGDAPQVWLVSNLKNLTRSGDQRDTVPTILTEMGVEMTKLQPRYKGNALTEPTPQPAQAGE